MAWSFFRGLQHELHILGVARNTYIDITKTKETKNFQKDCMIMKLALTPPLIVIDVLMKISSRNSAGIE